MFKFFKKNKSKNNDFVSIANPMKGKILNIEDVPDPVFAQKMVGDGFAVDPIDGEIHAPVSGEIVLQPDGLHALSIRTDKGLEIMVHFGMDTVELNGEGFSTDVNIGDKVEKGDVILNIDIDLVKKRVSSMISPVIITNPDMCEISEINFDAKQDEAVIKAYIK